MSNVYASADPELVKMQWAEALKAFNADEVKRGIASARTRKFAPNLGEFLHLCRPALDPEIGWLEAEKGLHTHANGVAFDWSHPAVYWAASAMAYEVRTSAYANVKKRWGMLLAAKFAAGEWASIPSPTAVRLSFDRQVERQNAFADEERERISAALRKCRLTLTGFETKAEQDAKLAKTDEQALRQPEWEQA